MSKNTSIEGQMGELRELVAWFESDDFEFEQAPEKFKAAAELAEKIEKDLGELKNSVTVLKQKFDAE